MASTNTFSSPALQSPSPSSSSDSTATVIVLVFVSFGCLLLLAILAVALFCFIKKKKKKTIKETDVVHAQEHLKVKKAISHGPHGSEAVMLEVEDDVHVDEKIKKDERLRKGMHAKSVEGNPSTIEEGTPSMGGSPD